MSGFTCYFFIAYRFPRRQDKWSGIPISKNFPQFVVYCCVHLFTLLYPLEFNEWLFSVSSVQFSCSVVSDSLQPHGLQYARLPCPSPAPKVYSNSCPLTRWCHLTISSSVIPFSSRLQSFPASGSFQMSRFFTGGQSIGVSASTSVLPMNIQNWFPLGWTGLISLQSKELSRVFFNTTVQKHQFFKAQHSLYSNSHIHTWLLEKPYLWLDGPLLAK